MTKPATRILVAGIGNIFLADDAFGVEVAQRLALRPLPDQVRVVDFGIRGLHLAYTLLEKIETVILVDAAPRGEIPGTVYLIEPNLSAMIKESGSREMIDAHTMHPEKVLRVAASMGANFDRVLLVGCEPMPFDPDVETPIGLSPPVQAAVDEAITLIESLITEVLHEFHSQPDKHPQEPHEIVF